MVRDSTLDDKLSAPAAGFFSTVQGLQQDLVAGLVVFLVALPLCLGVALACGVPPVAGLIAGIVGGLVVGTLSSSHTSVSGPAAGLTAVVAAQVASLGSLEGFLLALVIAGVIQLLLGALRAGFIASFFPSSVIQGLLSSIGLILILKQFPHLFGHDPDPDGEMSFSQPDNENTFTELWQIFGDWHLGAATIGFFSLAVLIVWDKIRVPYLSKLPAPLVVVILGILAVELFRGMSETWAIGLDHLVVVPLVQDFKALANFMVHPDFSRWAEPAIWTAGVTLALVASLETLLNLEAVDKLDPQQRLSSPNRELLAQGAGNILSGLIGGLPVTSVIVRSSVNINAGGRSRLATIFHGLLLLLSVWLLPDLLGRIPISCLAAILLMTGYKLASPKVFLEMWRGGKYRFLPFMTTVVAILFTDLLIGVLVGLMVGLAFILASNIRRPLWRVIEKHHETELVRFLLANQVSFLNRGALCQALGSVPAGAHLLIDASQTVYIDPDVLEMICEFRDRKAPARGIQLSLRGFRDRFGFPDRILYAEHATQSIQEKMGWQEVLDLLAAGNLRFRTGNRLSRDFNREVLATSGGQHPLAVVLSCMDSRSPAEILFDLGLGDILSVRVAGNVTSPKILGSLEYGCAVAGAKLIVVLGHTQCGAIAAAVARVMAEPGSEQPVLSINLEPIVKDICTAVAATRMRDKEPGQWPDSSFGDRVARRNVLHSVHHILRDSAVIRQLVEAGKVAVVGALYDIVTGRVVFLTGPLAEQEPGSVKSASKPG